jgi:signal transduction histidine kinase
MVLMARTKARGLSAQLTIAIVGVAVGVESLSISHDASGFSFAAPSALGSALELLAGWSLVLAGVLSARKATGRSFGGILALAGVCWLAAEWNDPDAGSAVVFSIGLVGFTVSPVLIAHAALRYPDRRPDPGESIALGVGYLSALVMGGLIPALFFNPARAGCNECPANLLLVHDAQILATQASRSAVFAGVIWAILLFGLIFRRFVRSSPARRRTTVPVLAPAAIFLAAVGVDYLHSLGRGFLGDDVLDRRLWMAQAILLVLMASGTGWAAVSLRRTRSAVARMVVETSEVVAAGGLARSLGRMLSDPGLGVLYPLSDGRWADSSGRLTAPDDGEAVTHLTRNGATVALLAHKPGLLDAPGVRDEIADTAALALDNERLQAERRAQLADLRASRARIVAAADAERRRLERNLHDGAQQKLVTLSLGLQLASLRLGPSAAPSTAVRLEEARLEVVEALGELRRIARGLYPRELADEGLSAALETLAETSSASVTVTSQLQDRLPHPVESGAYFAAAHCIALSGDERVSLAVVCDAGYLRLDVEMPGPVSDRVRLEDRIGALAGTVAWEPAGDGRARVRVELPCGS